MTQTMLHTAAAAAATSGIGSSFNEMDLDVRSERNSGYDETTMLDELKQQLQGVVGGVANRVGLPRLLPAEVETTVFFNSPTPVIDSITWSMLLLRLQGTQRRDMRAWALAEALTSRQLASLSGAEPGILGRLLTGTTIAMEGYTATAVSEASGGQLDASALLESDMLAVAEVLRYAFLSQGMALKEAVRRVRAPLGPWERIMFGTSVAALMREERDFGIIRMHAAHPRRIRFEADMHTAITNGIRTLERIGGGAATPPAHGQLFRAKLARVAVLLEHAEAFGYTGVTGNGHLAWRYNVLVMKHGFFDVPDDADVA